MRDKPILCLDFDGVVHSYENGWGDGSIYGTPTAGFADWAKAAAEHFLLVIHSSRLATPDGLAQVAAWLKRFDLDWIATSVEKPPAFITIDDRSIRFDGDWDVPSLDPDKLRTFKPWMMR